MLSFDEARALVLRDVTALGDERVFVADADGRALAEDVTAASPLPAFDHSAMDGYALATRDLDASGPFTLPVAFESQAGSVARALDPRTACRIFTGAPLPRGADAVLMQENVTRSSDAISFAERPRPFQHVRRAGEDVATGDVVLRRGTLLDPGKIALVAALDRAWVTVTRRPRVVVVATGDELRNPGEPPRAGSIPESNAIFVAAWARRAGATVTVAPFVRDDLATAERDLTAALAGADLVCTIGGVSVGDHDVVKEALTRAGVTITFHKVAMKPGKPLTLGRRGATHVLGLPGNPASASLTFLVFGVPLLERMLGLPDRGFRTEKVRLARAIDRKPGRLELVRARLLEAGGVLEVEPAKNQASGAALSFAEADALVVVGADVSRIEEGTMVDVHVIARR